MADLRVRYFAGAAAAAGTDEELLPLPADVAALRAVLVQRHPALEPVLVVATLLVDGVAAREASGSLAGVTGVDVLPPFSGG